MKQNKVKYGINDDVFLSVPCIVGREGIISMVNVTLNEEEAKKLRESAQTISEIQKGIVF